MQFDERQWAAIGDEAVQHLSRLLRFDTSSPPGNETPAAHYLKQILERAGVQELHLLEAAPRRGNLVARLRGDGTRSPLLLTAHLDVVPAEPTGWHQPPFGGVVADGAVWGRGALDMKHMAVMSLMMVLLLKRHELPLKRDLIFAAVADEENGGNLGARWLVENHPDLLRAEFALNELGGFLTPVGKHHLYPIQVAEKGPCRLQLRSGGRPGHGSIPHDENAVVRLAQAVARLDRGMLPIHVTPAVAAYIRAVAAALPWREGLLVRCLLHPRLSSGALKRLPTEQRENLRPLLSNTATVTGLRAGVRTNVIPSQAEADVDCRLLPGQTVADAQSEIGTLVGPEVEMEWLYTAPATEFRSDTPLFGVLADALRAHDPAARPVPYLMPASTDARWFARLGTIVYGFTPTALPDGVPLMRLIHSHDERIPVAGLHFGLRVLWDVVCRWCC